MKTLSERTPHFRYNKQKDTLIASEGFQMSANKLLNHTGPAANNLQLY